MSRLVCTSLLCLLLWFPDAFAQDVAAVLGPRLKMLLTPRPAGPRASKVSATRDLVQVLLKGELEAVRQAVQAAGGSIGTVVEDISTARVPLDAIRDVAAHPGVERMERALQLVRTNDVAAGHVGARAVLQGSVPLDRAYTGAGVLVGIIDSGIDFRHEDFRDPDDPGRSRILYIWDQADGRGRGPEGYGYGTVWTQEQIDSALEGQGNVRHLDEDGHGSHVSGSAAGNGAAVGRYTGMAPRADIIAVVDGGETETSVVDAAGFIYRIARERGQPAVVNLSAGTHFGPHDDSGLEVQALNALVEAAPGRAFVASAGNEGSDFIHWGGFPLEQDSLWTYYYVPQEAIFEDDTGGGLLGFAEFFSIVSAADAASTFIAMGIDRAQFRDFELTRLGYEGRTRWHSLRELVREDFGIFDTLRYRSGRVAGEVCYAAQTLENGDVAICIYVTDFITFLDQDRGIIVDSELWRFMARGSGQIHVWSEGVWSAENQFLDLEVTADRYRPTDNRYTVGLPAVGSQIIAVGAYVNVADEPDAVFNPDPTPAGDLIPWSSRGPTTAGRIKPEIVAPGHNVTSVLSSALDVQALEEEFGAIPVAPGGRHMVQSGTSMSAPVTTGSIALYLQQNPAATNAQIREVLFKNAATDAFTAAAGPLPGNDWGFGKLDIFAVLSAAPAALECIPGDVDGDDRVTLVDALFTLQASLGKREFSAVQNTCGDVNADDSITLVDALFILQASLGKRDLSAKPVVAARAEPGRPVVLQGFFEEEEDQVRLVLEASGLGPGALDLQLRYDPARLQWMGFEAVGTPAPALVEVHAPQAGALRLARLGITGPDQVELGWMVFQRRRGAGPARVEVVGFSHFSPSGQPLPTEAAPHFSARGRGLPAAFALYPNAPNPFNPATTIRYDLPGAQPVRLSLYNLSGQLIRMLVEAHQPAGHYSVVWDGRDDTGREVASGIYLYRLQAGAWVRAQKLVLVR